MSLDLRQLILELYERHLSPDGRSVSYKQLGSDPLFRRYVDAAAELQKVIMAVIPGCVVVTCTRYSNAFKPLMFFSAGCLSLRFVSHFRLSGLHMPAPRLA